MKRNNVLTLFFLLITSSIIGQVISPSPPSTNSFHTNIMYKETIRTFYVVDTETALTSLDKVQLKMTKDVKQYAKYYSDLNKMPISIIDRVETENIYSDWMIQPAKFVINDSGIAAYDETGGVLNETSHSSTYLGSMNELEGNVFGKMEEMSQERKNELIAEGLNVFNSNPEEVVVSSTYRSLTYNYADKTQTLTRFDDNRDAISTISTAYLPVTSIDPNHSDITDVLPFFIKEIRKVNLPSGACAEFVRTTHREDYGIIKGTEGVERSAYENLEGTISWYPNPVKDILTIENTIKETLTVKIYNLQGQKIKEVQTDSRIHLNIADFAKGIYILSIQEEDNETISKFVKS